MPTRVTNFFAYRWRYIIGYSFITAAIVLMLVVAAFFIPGELRQAEIDSALTSSSLGTATMLPEAVIDLPYHLLQKLSLLVFGVSTFSIKLPSIILGALTSLGIFLMIRTWFKANVAVLSTILVVITSQFLFLTQDGTPGIMFSFISIWLLFVATHVTRRKYFGTFWKVLTCLAMAAAMYTPMGVYLVLVMLVAAVLHPHIRFIIRRFNKYKITVALLLGLAALTPLAYAIYLQPSIASTLFGWPSDTTNLAANALQALKDMFGFTSSTSSYLIRPIYPIGLTLLMLVGLYRILTHRYTARSYVTIAWGLIIFALVLVNPGSVTNFYPIAVILASYGIIDMINSWYKIFPRNPYARVTGLIPLVILVLAMVSSGITRYTSTYRHNPQVMSHYSQDLKLFRQTLSANNATGETTQVIVTNDELELYKLINKYDNRFSLSTDPSLRKNVTIYSQAARPASIPTEIVINTRTENADRFYIYK